MNFLNGANALKIVWFVQQLTYMYVVVYYFFFFFSLFCVLCSAFVKFVVNKLHI